MDKYLDLVVCKYGALDKISVFRAPRWSYLNEGDRVVVELEKGQIEATVVRSYTIEKNSAEMDFIIVASGTTLPLKKVLKKITYKDFEYEEDEENE